MSEGDPASATPKIEKAPPILVQQNIDPIDAAINSSARARRGCTVKDSK